MSTDDDSKWTRDRKAAIAEANLNPLSLVGSWFHALEGDEIVWQGIVVAEVATGTYLVQLEDSIPGAKHIQRLLTIGDMVFDAGHEWRFYDTDAQMREAYAEWVTRNKDVRNETNT